MICQSYVLQNPKESVENRGRNLARDLANVNECQNVFNRYL